MRLALLKCLYANTLFISFEIAVFTNNIHISSMTTFIFCHWYKPHPQISEIRPPALVNAPNLFFTIFLNTPGGVYYNVYGTLKYENSDFHAIQENQFHEMNMHYEKNPKCTFQRHLYDLCVGETIKTIYS